MDAEYMGTRFTAKITSRSTAGEFAMREFLGDQRAHMYRKLHLADPTVQWLIPLCSEDNPYPNRHARYEIDPTYIHARSTCARCAELIRF